MTKQTWMALVLGIFSAFTVQITVAHEAPQNVPNIVPVIQHLQSKGYVPIHEIKFDDGMYKAEIWKGNDQEIKLEINPQTKEITQTKTKQETHPALPAVKLSLLEIVKKVEAAGYHSVYKIKFKMSRYEVKALDKEGKKVELNVDANTGKVNKEGWFD